MIRKIGPKKYRVLSEAGKNLGTVTGRTDKEARHKAHVRLGQIEGFKKRARKKH